MKKVLLAAAIAVVVAPHLAACEAVTVEGIRETGAKARAVVDEVRQTRCDTIPRAEIEELRRCEEAGQ
jgi:predicted small secreted protein